MTDYISRQAAIDAAIEATKKWDGLYPQGLNCEIQEAVNALPSAQPEIIRCKDCKHWEGERRGQFYYFEQCSLHECTASSDDFCSWAERRTDE